MTIKEGLERAKLRPSYSENFTEEGEKSLKTITTGLQATFIRRKNPEAPQEPDPKSEEPKQEKSES